MNKIRDAAQLIGMLGRGEFAGRLNDEMAETVAEMRERSGERPKAKIKGSVSVTLNFEMEDGALTINGEIKSKRPAEPPSSSLFFWTTEDGELTTEHPLQQDMFSGPREATGRETGKAAAAGDD